MIDSHAHLIFPEFRDSIDLILQRAKDSGISRIMSICTRIDDVDKIVEMARCYNGYISYSVGIHPDYAEGDYEKYGEAAILETIISNDEAIGVGECGFDFKNGTFKKDIQEMVFRIQIKAAISTNKVLIVHTRDAEDDTKRVVSEYKNLNKILFHCYTGTIDFAKFILDFGGYISFSGILTFKNAKSLHEVAKYVPLDKILIETDAPFLAPAPMRGKMNEPAFLKYTAEYLAMLKGVDTYKVIEETTENFRNLFLSC